MRIVADGIASIPIEHGAHEGIIEVVVVPLASNADVEAASITCFLEAGLDYLLLTREECQIAGMIEAGYRCVPSQIRFRSEVSISITPGMQD